MKKHILLISQSYCINVTEEFIAHKCTHVKKLHFFFKIVKIQKWMVTKMVYHAKDNGVINFVIILSIHSMIKGK